MLLARVERQQHAGAHLTTTSGHIYDHSHQPMVISALRNVNETFEAARQIGHEFRRHTLGDQHLRTRGWAARHETVASLHELRVVVMHDGHAAQHGDVNTRIQHSLHVDGVDPIEG